MPVQAPTMGMPSLFFEGGGGGGGDRGSTCTVLYLILISLLVCGDDCNSKSEEVN